MVGQIISLFNQFLAGLILSLFAFLPQPKITIPKVQIQNTASTSAIIQIPKIPISSPIPNIPWGSTEKIGQHQYRTYVADDAQMGSAQEILDALNKYRHNHGAGGLHSDDNLCKLAQSRAGVQQSAGKLDDHKGLIDYMNDQSHWSYLNITGIGENASYGYTLSGTHLIEWVFDSDSEHRDNQLNPSWNLACAGVSGVTVDIIFGKR